MICGHRHEQKFRCPYPRAKAIDQNPALCPASPSGLTLIGALTKRDKFKCKQHQQVLNCILVQREQRLTQSPYEFSVAKG